MQCGLTILHADRDLKVRRYSLHAIVTLNKLLVNEPVMALRIALQLQLQLLFAHICTVKYQVCLRIGQTGKNSQHDQLSSLRKTFFLLNLRLCLALQSALHIFLCRLR